MPRYCIDVPEVFKREKPPKKQTAKKKTGSTGTRKVAGKSSGTSMLARINKKAKSIRRKNEAWPDAQKRAAAMLRKAGR